MKLYFLNEKREVIRSQALPIERRKDGTYGLKGGADALAIGAWRVGLAIKTYDESNALRNDNGVYSTRLEVNGQLAHDWEADQLDFDETRYINALSDYPARQRYGAWFHRLFTLPGDQLSMYRRTDTQGAIALSTEQPANVQVQVSDAAGNISTVRFALYRAENMIVPTYPEYQYDFRWETENRFQTDDISVFLPKNCLYEDLRMEYHTTPDQSAGVYSPVHHLHHTEVPVHKYFDVALTPHQLPTELHSKAVVARCGDRRPDNCGGKWENGRLTTRIRSFGDYCIMVDDVPPTITPIQFDDDLRRKTSMAFRISDNFDVTDQADRLTWRGTIDGQWVLFELDSKKSRLVHRFDERTPPGDHVVRLVVKDDRNNEAVFEATFKK
jgi:hypothetical protein